MSGSTPRTARKAALLTAAMAAGALTTIAVSPAGAVVGDAAADGSYASTVRIAIGDNFRSCTGALVDRTWVLTAASCFSDDPAQPQALAAGAPKWKTTVTVGAKSAEVVELVPRADRDLVLARLVGAVDGVAPLPLASSAPAAGQSLRVAGFGRTKDEWVPSKLHSGVFSLDSVSPAGVGITGTGGAAVCKGDTGAPAFREVNGRAELVAVASRSWQGGCLGTPVTETRTGATASRVDDLGAWVQQVKASRPGSQAFVVDADGKLLTAEGSYTANVWGTLGQVPGGNSVKQVSAVTVNGTVRVFAVGSDNQVWTADKRPDGSWTTFGAIPGGGIQNVTATTTATGVRLFAVNANGAILTTDTRADGTWTPYDTVPGSNGVRQVSAVTVNGTIRLFAVGGDYKIWTADKRPDGSWTTFTALPSNGIRNIAVTTTATGVRLFTAGDDGKIWTTDSRPDGTWTTFDIVPGSNGVTQVAATTIGDTVRLFAVGGQQQVWAADKKPDGTWTEFTAVLSSGVKGIAATQTG